jgi:hypothetical protein
MTSSSASCPSPTSSSPSPCPPNCGASYRRTSASATALEDGHVTFSYRRSGSRRWRRMRLEATEFLRRFLQHVLPTGFQKIRHYGSLSPRSRSRFEAVRWLATLHAGEPFVLESRAPARTPPASPRPRCPACAGELHVILVLRRRGPALFDTS